MNRLHFSIVIQAPREKVWNTMLGDETYRQWTSIWMPGSHYDGDWTAGSKILFLAPREAGAMSGMVCRIRQNRLHEFISIESLGVVQDGKEITDPEQMSEKERGWIGSLEEYRFVDLEGKRTELTISQDVPEEYAGMFQTTWPKALQRLKELAEK